jgi:hypothetical protein
MKINDGYFTLAIAWGKTSQNDRLRSNDGHCLTINAQNKKGLSCDKPFYILVMELAGLELLIFIIISIIYVFFVPLESSQHFYMSQMLDTVLHFQHIHP